MGVGRVVRHGSPHRWLVDAIALGIFAGLAFAASALASGAAVPKPSGDAAVVAVRVGVGIGFAVALLTLGLGYLAGAHVSKLFVGEDNRISTSKTIAAVWTMVVAGALFGFVYANLFNHPQALNHTGGNVGQYAVLFGGPLGAAILAKQIVTTQVKDKKQPKPKGTPSPKDLIANDAGNTDLGDFQYVLFNLVAMFFVISTLFHTPLKGLPHIPDVLLGLTSVSAVGYVGKKALTPTDTPTAKLDPKTAAGPHGTAVDIEIRGLAPSREHLNTLVQFGPADDGQRVSSPVADGEATLHTNSPDLSPAADTPVNVTVVTDDGAVLTAGKYTYE